MAGEGDIFSGAASGAAAGSSAGPWGAAIGAGIGLIGGVASFLGKQDQARQLARENEEALRRKKAQDAQVFGAATAAGAASGIEFESGSLQNYLGVMQAEMRRQQEWMRQAGAAGVSALRSSAGFGLATDAFGALNGYAKANNYWRAG